MNVSRRLADIPSTLLDEIKATSLFKALISSIIMAFSAGADPKLKVSELSVSIEHSTEVGDHDDTLRHAVLALAAVGALQKLPNREMWEYLWSLAWHSAALDLFLPEAVVAASANEDFKRQFCIIAREVVQHAIQNPGRRAIQREKDVAPLVRQRWHEDRRLSPLWSGNFGHSVTSIGRDDDNVLSIVAKIDAAEFVHMLDLYDYPDPIVHALMWSGAGSRFEYWRAVVIAAPLAFTEQAKWNGSLVLPLLLSMVKEQLYPRLSRQPEAADVADATDEIKSLAAEVMKVIGDRTDAVGCMTRWGNWLIRSAMPAISANKIPYPSDAASQGFVEDALIEALIAKLPTSCHSLECPPDSEAWEPWCHFAVAGLIAVVGKAPMPSPIDFTSDWQVSPEEWSTERGAKLRSRDLWFLMGADLRADGYGARLLAVPMIHSAGVGDRWGGFWRSTDALREIVEFGEFDENDEGSWQGKSDAARLLTLQWSVGLMMMDHLISPPLPLAYDRQPAIEELFRYLDEAAREMGAIDRLNEKYWSEAIRHLAIRRERLSSDGSMSEGIQLSEEVKPTLRDFIHMLSGDTESLLTLAYVAVQNGLDKQRFAAAFSAAGIDLEAEVALGIQLLELSPRAICLGKDQIDIVRAIAGEVKVAS